MMHARSTFVSAAALVVALSLTAAQAEPQPNAMSPGGAPAAGNLGAGDGGAMGPDTGGRPDQQGSTAGQSDPVGAGQGDAGSKGSAAGSPSPEGNAAKGREGTAEAQDKAETPGDSKAGRSAGDKAGSTAESRSDTKGGMSEDSKSSTAEGKGDGKGKAGKSARLEFKDVSKVKTYFRQNKPNAKRIDRDDVSVSIGIALPGAIALYDLPPNVIVVGGPCPIRYFVWGDDLVLVDSRSREVVEIIADVG